LPRASGAVASIHTAAQGESTSPDLASVCGHTDSLNSFTLSKFEEARTGVASYRAYFLNAGGHIVRAVELACETDEDAAQEARRLLNGQAIELWERARMIARFDPAQKPA
jgi:hypothetical protein